MISSYRPAITYSVQEAQQNQANSKFPWRIMDPKYEASICCNLS